MTRVLVAFDKFKDALTAREACSAAARGLHASHPDWTLDLCPLTDGGEGFGEILTLAAHGQLVSSEYSGPRGERITAPLGRVRANDLSAFVRTRLGLAANAPLAILEMAATSGLALLPLRARDPWQTSSIGTGEQIRDAATSGANAILLGIGGSATNDLGLGALASLGYHFIAADGSTVSPPTPANWVKIIRIERKDAVPLPPLFIACDVTNPLLGSRGATATFGQQKGLAPADVPRLEAEMARMAGLLCAACGQPFTLAEAPGAGAAGGIAFGLRVAANAQLIPGFALVSDWLDLPARIAAADLIITGEGRFDATSLDGKGPGSVVAAARRLGKPAYIFAGCMDLSAKDRERSGVNGYGITPDALPLSEALPRTAELLTAAVVRFL